MGSLLIELRQKIGQGWQELMTGQDTDVDLSLQANLGRDVHWLRAHNSCENHGKVRSFILYSRAEADGRNELDSETRYLFDTALTDIDRIHASLPAHQDGCLLRDVRMLPLE